MLASALSPALAQVETPSPRSPSADLELQLSCDLLDLQATRVGWTPCEVLVTNLGLARAVELQLRLTYDTGPLTHAVRQRVDLSLGQSRRLWFLVPVQEGGYQVHVSARELSEGGVAGRQLAGATQSLSVVDDTYGYRRGVESRLLYVREWTEADTLDDPLSWVSLGSGWGRRTDDVGWREPSRLPAHPFAYDGVDMVILHEVDFGQLERVQADALLAWVETGGRVLLIPGGMSSWFDQPFVQELIGAQRFSAEVCEALPLLTRHYQQRPPRAPDPQLFVLQSDPPAPDQVAPIRSPAWDPKRLPALRPGSASRPFDRPTHVPLAYRFERGEGLVFVLALDPSAAAFRHWVGRGGLFASLLAWTDVARAPRWRTKHDQNANPIVRPRVTEPLDSRHRPSRAFVVGMVLAYVLCVGPLNFWLLGRRGQRQRLVLTVPLISLAFTLSVFAVGYATGGLSSVVWRVSLIDARFERRWAWERTSASVLSAMDREHQVELDPALASARVFSSQERAFAAPADRVVVEGAHARPAVDLEMWGMAYFEGQRVRDLGGGVRLRGDGSTLRLVNDSSLLLERGLLFAGEPGRPFPVGRVAPGESLVLGERLPALPPLQRRGGGTVPRFYGRPELAQALFPSDEEQAGHCAGVLEAYGITPPGSSGSRLLLVGLLTEVGTRLVANGSDQVDRGLDLLVVRDPR
jgi:hypothetical protein